VSHRKHIFFIGLTPEQINARLFEQYPQGFEIMYSYESGSVRYVGVLPKGVGHE
jgi:hypothetical protein